LNVFYICTPVPEGLADASHDRFRLQQTYCIPVRLTNDSLEKGYKTKFVCDGKLEVAMTHFTQVFDA